MPPREQSSESPVFMDPDLPIDERVDDLVSRMTLEEKVSQMTHEAPAIERLGVPKYTWWNECLHGVARAGIATVFPQAIGLAATFNPPFIQGVAAAISDEARAKHHEAVRQDDRDMYKGLTFWTPNINIFRDPRWGRGHETYGEDPYLTGRIGVAFVKGLQGDHPKYLKTVATPKHYAVHSGPEPERHRFNAKANPKDFRETYLPAFRDCVVEGKAFSIMGAYNRTNGEACCASKTLLQDILRDEWGFEGYVVSDCGAIFDIHMHHKTTKTGEESAALAVKNGCDLNCGSVYPLLVKAVEQGLIAEDEIDVAVKRLFKARFLLGMFDPPEMVPFASIPYEVNDSAEHRELAREAARQSIVLLRNEGSLLPLPDDLKAVAVIGPNAREIRVLIGNYYGEPSKYVTLVDGIRNRLEPKTKVYYSEGCELSSPFKHLFSEAVSMAGRSDVIIACLGFSPALEGEEGEVAMSDGGGDRRYIHLPGVQQELLERLCSLGKPVVLVTTGGSAVGVNWAAENVPAILHVWYPGAEGGSALADVLFGDFNPAGRLPVTFVISLDDVPPFGDYSMKNRTYRYMETEPLYPFGYGLSYTEFEYSKLAANTDEVGTDGEVQISVNVKNAGKVAGDEVVQLYLGRPDGAGPGPLRRLQGIQRIHLAPGESKQVSFTLTPRDISGIDEEGNRVVVPGEFEVAVGGSQPDPRSETLTGRKVSRTRFRVTGESRALEY